MQMLPGEQGPKKKRKKKKRTEQLVHVCENVCVCVFNHSYFSLSLSILIQLHSTLWHPLPHTHMDINFWLSFTFFAAMIEIPLFYRNYQIFMILL